MLLSIALADGDGSVEDGFGLLGAEVAHTVGNISVVVNSSTGGQIDSVLLLHLGKYWGGLYERAALRSENIEIKLAALQ